MPWETVHVRAPHFASGVWLNGEPRTMADLVQGGPVLVDFWDFTCINCLRTLPYLLEWHERYAGLGLTVVGIHTPEFTPARAPEAVAAAVARLAIPYPVLVDAEGANWSAWANRAWPTKYLVDGAGRLRYTRQGEGKYGETEAAIQTLLRERHGAELALPPPLTPLRPSDALGAVCYRATPELHAGWAHGRLGNRPDWECGVTNDFQVEGERAEGKLYFAGRWRPEVEFSEAEAEGATLRVPYLAAEAYAVLGTGDGTPRRVWVEQDGQPLGFDEAGDDVVVDSELGSYIIVRAMRAYSLVVNPDFRPHELALRSALPGLQVFSLAFVPCVQPPAGAE